MIVIGFPRDATGYANAGLQWGPYARTGNHEGMPAGITDAQLSAARAYGAHVCEMAGKLLRE
jgi:NAD(P)H dehydrogenase (quinone)